MTAMLKELAEGNRIAAEPDPGEFLRRQPVHTVYGGAHLFKANLVQKFGAIALGTLREYAPTPDASAIALGLDRSLADRVYPRIVDKLTREPVEDFRIDFEDGFGNRSDDEEDRVAVSAARELADAGTKGALPPGVGIRIKPLGDEHTLRGLRTFDLFLTALLDATGNALPSNFVITLPKITAPGQVAALASACDTIEDGRKLPRGVLRLEIMVETTQSILAADGTIALPRLVAAGRGRIVAAHFGPYDYTAACNITSAHQHTTHPACDFARHIMQVALAGTGIGLSDGPTNILPIGPHRSSPDRTLTSAEREENRRIVHRAWRMHADHIRRALASGFYQGWDLHPAQLPARYAAVYAFFLEGLDAASERLRHFVEKAGQATRVRDVFDDAATGQGLLNHFLRAMRCGAVGEQEAVEKSGLTIDELRGRSFSKILGARKPRQA